MRQFNRRQLLESKWLELINCHLPILAQEYNLTVTDNHCFARCIYDYLYCKPWDTVIPEPAYEHLSDYDLEIAILLAKEVLREPVFIEALNQYSQNLRTPTRPFHILALEDNNLFL